MVKKTDIIKVLNSEYVPFTAESQFLNASSHFDIYPEGIDKPPSKYTKSTSHVYVDGSNLRLKILPNRRLRYWLPKWRWTGEQD